MNKRKTRPGWISTEFAVSMLLLWMILGVLAAMLNVNRKYNRLQLTRQQCLAAARSQMSSLTATGASISDADISRLWKNISVTVEESEGSGQWDGLKLLEVTASRKLKKRLVRIELKKYVYAEGQ
ncbi:MAG: hypothetical protein FVQ82_02425 [Planctomycetes bacterium]|nr:hypothetical protein [Planctomycetota bacterium]